jgi:hypothetical protein
MACAIFAQIYEISGLRWTEQRALLITDWSLLH